ncbi:MAG: ATP synthase F1 subunit delta [candidate division Zixibacteria bacterium]|nr:ATP synthase F1 subunit delta [candidate division Zixibacteria bacterium]
MLVQEVARKYAQALFMAVKEKGLIDTAREQLDELMEFIEKDNTLLNFLNAPYVSDETKLTLMRNVFEGRLEQLLVEFLIVLIEKNRMVYLAEIVDDFVRLVEAEKGIARTTVITTEPLDNNQRRDLISRLTAKTDMTIQLEEKVDPNILGGMIVVFYDEIIDGSVRYGLDMMEKQLTKVKVV